MLTIPPFRGTRNNHRTNPGCGILGREFQKEFPFILFYFGRLPWYHWSITKESEGLQFLGIQSYSQMMSKGCPITETKRIVFRFHDTILRFGEPGSLGNVMSARDAMKSATSLRSYDVYERSMKQCDLPRPTKGCFESNKIRSLENKERITAQHILWYIYIIYRLGSIMEHPPTLQMYLYYWPSPEYPLGVAVTYIWSALPAAPWTLKRKAPGKVMKWLPVSPADLCLLSALLP